MHSYTLLNESLFSRFVLSCWLKSVRAKAEEVLQVVYIVKVLKIDLRTHGAKNIHPFTLLCETVIQSKSKGRDT